ncbi:hypothetical protein GIY56_08580 [Paracoccus sp. YIM 132242]|uniref:Uncharacterized protein n=1 Tax=Paracoccus lichenicola TaxID=2665644 RepID=A0A6L6HPX5_9RHOB|nr:hypothetical protein [Paracoccus lichenicola]MTE00340.1 hypothetical protein [Paracoccus lichenicola]
MNRAIAAALWLGLSALTASPVLAGEAGDAVFAERGPWSLEGRDLNWTMHVEGPQVPGFLPIDDGSVTLTQATDPSDKQPVLQLVQKTDARTRRIGPFPISGGDPVLTFFLEQTTRDMARLTGGSPFYIRNRIKEALFQGGQIVPQDDESVASFQPFARDPNAARMGGFQTLTLTFVLGDPAQPIRELRAETQGETPGYVNRMALQ